MPRPIGEMESCRAMRLSFTFLNRGHFKMAERGHYKIALTFLVNCLDIPITLQYLPKLRYSVVL